MRSTTASPTRSAPCHPVCLPSPARRWRTCTSPSSTRGRQRARSRSSDRRSRNVVSDDPQTGTEKAGTGADGAVPLPPARRRAHHWKAVATAAFLCAAAGVIVLAAVQTVGEIEASLPAFPAPAAIPTSPIAVDRDGKLLRPFTIADGRWRLPVTVDEVDKRYLAMLIAYED